VKNQKAKVRVVIFNIASLNLSYSILLVDSYTYVCEMIQSFGVDSTGVVYCMTQKNTEELTDFLREKNV
jgi:superfamily II DNA helicase RecQ